MSRKIILTYYVGHVTPNSVKPLHLIINKINGSIEESNGSKYLTVVPDDESKTSLKTYEELWDKITDLGRSASNNSDDYDKKYMKVKSNSDGDLRKSLIF